MNRLTQADLLSLADYERQRVSMRQEIIALKARRRIDIGPLVTLVFENRRTLLFQIQEMIRAEQIVAPSKIQDEIDVYNALLPHAGELSATLMIAIRSETRVKDILDSFQHFDRADTLGITVRNHTVFADFEGGHSKEDKISAVHFVRIKIPPSFRQALQELGSHARMTITHTHHAAEANVPPAMQEEWLNDLEA